MSAHTPGPWRVVLSDHKREIHVERNQRTFADMRPRAIAILPFEREHADRGTKAAWVDGREDAANFDLIAAAPSLLSTCEAVAHQLEHGEASEGDARDLAWCVRELRTVISQAKGSA